MNSIPKATAKQSLIAFTAAQFRTSTKSSPTPTLPPDPNRQPSTTMSYPLETALRARKTPITGVREKQFGKTHDVFEGAPCDWSAAQGATHTLYCGEVEGPFRRPGSGTRPAKLAKTVLYVGTDEDDAGNIVWEKWQIATKYVFANAA